MPKQVVAILRPPYSPRFKLMDYDGKPTRWGKLILIISIPFGLDQRGLNAMMMLSFLNVASI